MTKNKTGYGTYTIGSLIEHIKQLVEDNTYLNMNSPVFISDYAMSGYKHEFDILPTFSPYTHQAGLCLFHSLNEEASNEPVVEGEIEEEEVTYEEDTYENVQPNRIGVSRIMEWYKS